MGFLKNWFAARQPKAAPARRRIHLDRDPGSVAIYAIGDVHGCLDYLKDVEQRIAADIAANGREGIVVLLGDYIDRGPDSRQVLDHLIAPSALGLKRIPLCGNHEDVFHHFLQQPDLHREWLGLGGEQTLMSYGIDLHHVGNRSTGREAGMSELLAEAIPPSHRQFVADLPIYVNIGNLLLVHAGIRPGMELAKQRDEDMLWIREPFLSEGPKLPLLVVHGHTPMAQIDRGPGRIGIDTAAVQSGRLTVIKLDAGRVSEI